MPIESSILAAFGATLLWGIGDFLIQRETRKVGDVESLAFIGMIGAIGLFPFVLPELRSLFTFQNILLLSFVGAVVFITSMFYFEALRKGKLSVVDVIIEIELPVTVMLSFLFFGESLSFVQMSTIALVFVGIIMISMKSFSAKHLENFKKLEKGAMLAFLAAIFMGLENFLTAVGSKQVSPLMVIWVPWVIISIVSLAFIWKKKNGFESLSRDASRFRRLIILTGVIDTLGWLLYASALAKNELAITTAITESYPAICIILGVWLNKEKIMPHQYAGAFLALLASISLAMMG